MRLGRLLRWGRVGFLRRRLPYIWDIVRAPWRSALWWASHPRVWFEMRRYRRARAAGEDLLGV